MLYYTRIPKGVPFFATDGNAEADPPQVGNHMEQRMSGQSIPR